MFAFWYKPLKFVFLSSRYMRIMRGKEANGAEAPPAAWLQAVGLCRVTNICSEGEEVLRWHGAVAPAPPLG